MLDSAQEAFVGCLPAPDPGSTATQWNSPIGFSGGIYYNQSPGPVTVESASLLDPHNLTLHGVFVYKMSHYNIALPYEWPWGQEGSQYSAAQWAAIRQPIPGAIIPPEKGPIPVKDFDKTKPDVYEVAVDMSASSHTGGWAAGVVLEYRTGSATYTSTLRVGLVITPWPSHGSPTCDPQTRSIQEFWKTS
jgi:hypothetical protein